ncbi:hypothetical protein [Paenibacillus sp. WLX2291]|uniref:hypothetical protein n=1 Tax=Paenibacillus sp. WLX2291 TaxID=3296934 RepID=UPI0039844AC7
MRDWDNTYGAYAKVFIQYNGSLQELGSNIERGLDTTALRFDTTEDEPHDLVGYVESFGFEIELKKVQKQTHLSDYQYILSAFTMDSFQEIYDDRMFDISLWMARYISLVCKLTTMVEHSNKRTRQSFYIDPVTGKRETSFLDDE